MAPRTTTQPRTPTKTAAAVAPQPETTTTRPVADAPPQPHPLTDEELQLLTGAADRTQAAVTAVPGPPPTMAPPQAATAELPGSAGTPITGQQVVATYAEQTNRNAWAYLSTAGWKKLSDLTDTGSTTMTLLAAHARATGSAPYVDENPSGTIGTLYVW